MLLKVMQEHTNLSTLCGFKGDETSIDFCNEGLLPVDAMLIAPEIRVMASLTSADFSQNQLGPEGVKALAPALAASASLTSVSLADNRLCGVDGDGNGTYDATGIKAIADALRVNASLTSLSLRENNIKGTGEALWEALKNNSCIKTLDLCLCSLGPEDGTGLAGGIAVSASLTEVYICGNNIRNGGAEAIANALKANDSCVLKKLAVDLGLEDHEGLKSACQLRGVELEGVE
ncbi:hypothetical protein EMIHUDRAFT_453269 [Emiliania huxleyi CCMP1516]|nr:hypothetical protein EMIHUDRAFT_453269 [Emiliania huxleyi CCMP1516]EOD07673.1 hypothetical protein EMIHUDRAFT_453269 [Emiliania huxleyi CCMP1516]|eukprot:XP_005760102.1 hypothetical protein EMIHUDRAFT_453269 [Emiliania huxleyi CCMP1516]